MSSEEIHKLIKGVDIIIEDYKETLKNNNVKVLYYDSSKFFICNYLNKLDLREFQHFIIKYGLIYDTSCRYYNKPIYTSVLWCITGYYNSDVYIDIIKDKIRFLEQFKEWIINNNNNE